MTGGSAEILLQSSSGMREQCSAYPWILYRECIGDGTFEQLVISLFWILFQNSVHLESFLNPFLIALQIFFNICSKNPIQHQFILYLRMPEGLSVTQSIQVYQENTPQKTVVRIRWTRVSESFQFILVIVQSFDLNELVPEFRSPSSCSCPTNSRIWLQ